jgi:4a-hydroxytetrahydrobiopterin dehydratase
MTIDHRHVTLGCKAIYPDEAIQAYPGFLARRRSLRPAEEHRVPTDAEGQPGTVTGVRLWGPAHDPHQAPAFVIIDLTHPQAFRHWKDDLMSKLTGQQIADERLDGWAYLLGGLQTRIHTRNFATGLSVVNAIGAAAEEMNHHPDFNLRYTHVDVRLTSHDEGAVTDRDIRLARAISSIAAAAGVQLDSANVSRLELALDTPARESILPFWSAVLATEHLSGSDFGDELRDPADGLPTVWFQTSGSEEPRQRWHLDMWVDPAQVQPRIDAALAAGGTLVSDAEAPSFWVLADPQGNRACLCTWQDRG